MTRADAIPDDLWAVLETVLPPARGRVGRPWNDHRSTLEGIIWRFRTGAPWRDVPAEFGPFQSVWQRHRNWSFDGTYAAMLDAVADQPWASEEDLADLLSVDSTSVRAHQHAAGALRSAPIGTGGRIE